MALIDPASLPRGFRYAGVRCGLKNRRNDLGLLVSDAPAKAAGVFTRNAVRAACVDHTRSALAGGELRALVVNSGNANCCTGEQGARDAAEMARLASAALGLAPVAVASTGVIGQPLDMAKVAAGIASAAGALGVAPAPFMEAILTTDLTEKHASAELECGARIFGVAKGSGMIAPDMATLLAFVTTDADVRGLDLAGCLRRACATSFNRMTVDSDTSTNDMLLALANGASGAAPAEAEFQAGLDAVCLSLAKQVARDGEGATKLVEVRVRGSADPARVARSIAESPLVKTAMFGCDPNWGRIMMAAGKAGVAFDPGSARLTVRASGGSFTLFEAGAPGAFDPKQVSAALKADEVELELDLGPGDTATIYTCDFGYGYIRINAEYHT